MRNDVEVDRTHRPTLPASVHGAAPDANRGTFARGPSRVTKHRAQVGGHEGGRSRGGAVVSNMGGGTFHVEHAPCRCSRHTAKNGPAAYRYSGLLKRPAEAALPHALNAQADTMRSTGGWPHLPPEAAQEFHANKVCANAFCAS